MFEKLKGLIGSAHLTGAAAATKKPYTGKYPDVSKIKRGYFKKGDKGAEITKLQNYLNWYTDGEFFKKCGKPDGTFGANTDKYVKKMQTKFFGKAAADGTVGKKTIAKMKAYSNSFKPQPTPPTPTPGTYTGKYPEVRVKRTNAEVIAYTIKWAKWIAANNDFHYGYGNHAHHNGCYFCNTNQAKKGYMKKWEHTYCCNPFVHAAWAHGGLVPKALSMCDNGKSWDFNKGSGYDASSLFTKISTKNLKPGDVLCSDSHVVLYLGNGKVVQAGHEDNNVPGSSSWNSSISIGSWGGYSRAYRFNGSVNADVVIRKGEVSERVKDLQKYLIWYGALSKDETPDEYYGEKTYKAVVKMQTDFFGKKEADGVISAKTIDAMKKVKR